MPLGRALSKLGYASRSEARELIRAGRVQVNGRVVIDAATPVSLAGSRVTIDGLEPARPEWRLIAFHKPGHVVTTRRDPQGRTTIYDLLTDLDTKVVPVGRLDFASTGLLLLTSDTTLADWLTDPRTALPRRYVVTVRGKLDDRTAADLVSGVRDRGELLRASTVTLLKRSGRETHLIVELREGKNREIRRMMAARGHDVTRLTRIAFGGIELGTLAPGARRDITRAEAQVAFPGAPLGEPRRAR